jgi:hypothetical protein
VPATGFLDHASWFSTPERATALDVPVYLHPALATENLRREHYDGFGASDSHVLGAAPGADTPKQAYTPCA